MYYLMSCEIDAGIYRVASNLILISELRRMNEALEGTSRPRQLANKPSSLQIA